MSFSEARRGCEECASAAPVCGFMRRRRCCRQLVRVAVCGYSLADVCALVIPALAWQMDKDSCSIVLETSDLYMKMFAKYVYYTCEIVGISTE